jgi:hypothetical protein
MMFGAEILQNNITRRSMLRYAGRRAHSPALQPSTDDSVWFLLSTLSIEAIARYSGGPSSSSELHTSPGSPARRLFIGDSAEPPTRSNAAVVLYLLAWQPDSLHE